MLLDCLHRMDCPQCLDLALVPVDHPAVTRQFPPLQRLPLLQDRQLAHFLAARSLHVGYFLRFHRLSVRVGIRNSHLVVDAEYRRKSRAEGAPVGKGESILRLLVAPVQTHRIHRLWVLHHHACLDYSDHIRVYLQPDRKDEQR